MHVTSKAQQQIKQLRYKYEAEGTGRRDTSYEPPAPKTEGDPYYTEQTNGAEGQRVSGHNSRAGSRKRNNTRNRNLRAQIHNSRTQHGVGRAQSTNQLVHRSRSKKRQSNRNKRNRKRGKTGLARIKISSHPYAPFLPSHLTHEEHNDREWPSMPPTKAGNPANPNIHLEKALRVAYHRKRSRIGASLGTNRNIGYKFRLDNTIPAIRATKSGISMSGTEYITTLSAFTTVSTSPSPTVSGCGIYQLPLSPFFWENTSIWKEMQRWGKWALVSCCFEFVPITGQFQNGAIIMVCTHDPEQNISLGTDAAQKRRLMAALKGADEFAVTSYGRTYFHEDGSLNWQFTSNQSEPQLSIPGQFMVMAATSFYPPSEDADATSIQLGDIVCHYHVRFEDRIMDDVTPVAPVEVASCNFNATATASLVYLSEQTPMCFIGANFTNETGIVVTANQDSIYMFTGQTAGQSDAGSWHVNTRHRSGEAFMAQGSFWWGFWSNVPNSDIGSYMFVIVPTMEEAINKTLGTYVAQSFAGTEVLTFRAKITEFRMDTTD